MRIAKTIRNPLGYKRRGHLVAAGILSGSLLLSLPVWSPAQNSLQRIVGTGELPPAAAYEYRLSVMNNNGVDIRQGLFGVRQTYRGKWLGPVLRDHQINATRDVAFAIAEETGALRGVIFLREAATSSLRRIVQIGDRTPEGEVFTRILEFSLNDMRQILFTAETSGAPPEEGFSSAGLFLADGSQIRTLLRTGETTSWGTFVSFSTPRLTPDGRAYFTAQLRRESGALENAIFRLVGQTPELLVRAGDPNAAGGAIAIPLLQAVAPQGEALVLLDQGDKSLYVKAGPLPTRVVKIGDAAPGPPGWTFADVVPPIDTIFPAVPFLVSPNSLASNGDFVFIGSLQRPNQNPRLALYRYTGGSGLQELIRTEQSVGNFTVQFLTAPTWGEQGVIYCGASSRAILGGGILRFSGNQRQAIEFPEATATTDNLPPYAINRLGHAVYDHVAVVLNPNFSMPTGPFDKPAFGLNISLRLYTGSPAPETVVGPVQQAPSDSPFLGFSNFAANTRGDLLFIGNVSGGRNLFLVRGTAGSTSGASEGGAIVSASGGTIELVAHQGQVISGLKVRSVTDAAINDAGTIALQVEIEDGSALFVRQGGVFQKVLASGDLLFNKRVTDIFDISLNQNGRIAFIANLTDDTGANLNHLLLLARPTSGGYVIDSVTDLNALPSIRGARPIFFMDVALGDDGKIAFTVRAPRDEAVFVATPRQTGFGYTFTKIAESDGATPAGGKFLRGSELQIGAFAPQVFSSLQINAQGIISFIGAVSLSGGETVRGLFSYSGGSLMKVVADGDPTSEGPPLKLYPFSPAHTMAPAGEIAFLGLEADEPVLYLWRQGSVQRLIFSGQIGPQGEELTPLPPLLAIGGRVIFLGALQRSDSRLAIYALAVP